MHRASSSSPLARRVAAVRRWARAIPVLAVAGVIAALPACGGRQTVETPITAAPASVVTGPDFLRGTVGSYCGLRPGSGDPLLVGGYGIVFLPKGQGTGSSEVPPQLRQRLIQEMRRQGIGSPTLRAQAPEALKPFLMLTPQQVLDLRDTAVVRVEGMIPPGASRGTKFDVLVTAIDRQTTSLTGGTLFTTEMGLGGTLMELGHVRTLARAKGPLYLNPKENEDRQAQGSDFNRQGVIVLGAEAAAPREVELMLNQPSWTRSRTIANRINERFGRNTDDLPMADPKTDLRIQINIPPRWAAQPEVLLDLIAHLHVEPLANMGDRVHELATALAEDPSRRDDVVPAWRALGPNALPALRTYYGNSTLELRLAALEAGAWLGDEPATRHLSELANHPNPAIRIRVADALVHVPKSLHGNATLRRLLDDDDTDVRIAAYESLATNFDNGLAQIVDRWPIRDHREVKFLIDRVPAERPLIYVTQRRVPRVVVFGSDLRFEQPMLARVWDNRLMLRMEESPDVMKVFYQPPQQSEPVVRQVGRPSVAALAYVLGHAPHAGDLNEGMGLSYGQVVDALYELCEAGNINAPIRFHTSRLAEEVDRLQDEIDERPELAQPPTESWENVGVPGEGVERVDLNGQ